MKYQYSISLVPGTEFHTEVDAYVNTVMNTLPATDKMLDKIRNEQNHDRSCVQPAKHCQDGWPDQTNSTII